MKKRIAALMQTERNPCQEPLVFYDKAQAQELKDKVFFTQLPSDTPKEVIVKSLWDFADSSAEAVEDLDSFDKKHKIDMPLVPLSILISAFDGVIHDDTIPEFSLARFKATYVKLAHYMGRDSGKDGQILTYEHFTTLLDTPFVTECLMVMARKLMTAHVFSYTESAALAGVKRFLEDKGFTRLLMLEHCTSVGRLKQRPLFSAYGYKLNGKQAEVATNFFIDVYSRTVLHQSYVRKYEEIAALGLETIDQFREAPFDKAFYLMHDAYYSSEALLDQFEQRGLKYAIAVPYNTAKRVLSATDEQGHALPEYAGKMMWKTAMDADLPERRIVDMQVKLRSGKVIRALRVYNDSQDRDYSIWVNKASAHICAKAEGSLSRYKEFAIFKTTPEYKKYLNATSALYKEKAKGNQADESLIEDYTAAVKKYRKVPHRAPVSVLTKSQAKSIARCKYYFTNVPAEVIPTSVLGSIIMLSQQELQIEPKQKFISAVHAQVIRSGMTVSALTQSFKNERLEFLSY